MANYNVDLLIKVEREKAAAALDKLGGQLDELRKKGELAFRFGKLQGIKQAESALNQIKNVLVRGIGIGGLSIVGQLNTQFQNLSGVTGNVAKGLGSAFTEAVKNISGIGTGLVFAGEKVADIGTAFAHLPPEIQGVVAGIAVLFPQLFKLERAAANNVNKLLKIPKAFNLIEKEAQKANGSLINGMTGVQAAIHQAAEAQRKFDQALKGAALKDLNKITREAKNTLEGYWSMTGKAEKAAENYVKALKAQKKEQQEINKLVKKAQQKMPLSKEEQKEAAVALAAQKELALAKRADEQKQLAHERRMRKFAREKVKAAKEKKAIEDQARKNERLREGLMLGVGFPLLFGGGPGAILGGGAGALAQSQMGEGKGFGAQIALSAVGGQIDRLVSTIVKGMVEAGKAVTTTAEAYAFLEEKTLFSSEKIKERAAKLKEQGEVEKLNTLLSEEYIRLVGREGFNALQDAGIEAKNLKTAWEELTLAMSALMAGPLGDLLEKVTEVARSATNNARLQLLEQDLIAQGDTDIAKKLRDEIDSIRMKSSWSDFLLPGTGMKELSQEQQEDLLKRYGASRKVAKGDMTFSETGDLGKTKTQKKTKQQLLDEQKQKLEQIFQLGERQATIEEKIRNMKADGITYTEEEYRNKLKEIDQLTDINELYKGIGQTIKDGLVEGINAAIDGTKTLGEIASNVFRQISNQLISYGINASLGSIPGLEKIFGRASGGPVTGGSPYVVGEKGPELFVPGSSGNIVPNHAMGGTNVVVNVDASGSSVEGDGGQAEELGGMLAAAVQAEIANQQRPGGLLAGTR